MQNYWESVKFKEPDAIFGMNEIFKAVKTYCRSIEIMKIPIYFLLSPKWKNYFFRKKQKVIPSFRNIYQSQAPRLHTRSQKTCSELTVSLGNSD